MIELTFYKPNGDIGAIQDIQGWSAEEVDRLIEAKRGIDGQTPHELVRLCSYCGQIYGLKPTSLGTIGISHGICESCKPAANAELEAAFAEWKGDNHG